MRKKAERKILITENIRKKIVFYRQRMGYDQDEIADILGIPRTTYWYKENSAVRLPESFFTAFAEACQISPSIFLDIDDQEPVTATNLQQTGGKNLQLSPKEERIIKMLRLLPYELFDQYYDNLRTDFQKTLDSDD